MGHYDRVCDTKPQNRPQWSPKTIPVKAIHEPWEQEGEDYMPQYTPNYLTFMAEEHKVLAAPVSKIHSHSTLGEHIKSIWLWQSPNSKIQQIDCKVDNGTGCNIFPFYKAQTHF